MHISPEEQYQILAHVDKLLKDYFQFITAGCGAVGKMHLVDGAFLVGHIAKSHVGEELDGNTYTITFLNGSKKVVNALHIRQFEPGSHDLMREFAEAGIIKFSP